MRDKIKSNFRQTRAWKDFRIVCLEKAGYRCECCGTKYTKSRRFMLQLHHKDPENYTILDPDQFRTLCSECHELVERIHKKLHAKKYTLLHEEAWLNLLSDYLPK